MVVLTALNLGPTARTPDLSLDFFRQAWTSPTTWSVMANTAIFALGSTTLAMIIGVFFAFMVERTDMPMKNFAYAVVPLTIAMPGLLYAIAWVLLLSPRIGLFNLALLSLFGKDSGLLTSWAHIGFDGPPIQAYSMLGMIFVDAIRGVGVVFLMTVGVFRNMDPALEEAAMVSGAAAARRRAPDHDEAHAAGHPGRVRLLDHRQPRDLRGAGHHGPARQHPPAVDQDLSAQQDRRRSHRQLDRHRLHLAGDRVRHPLQSVDSAHREVQHRLRARPTGRA